MDIRIEFYNEDGHGEYVATSIDFPGISAFGETEEEALREFADVLDGIFNEEK